MQDPFFSWTHIEILATVFGLVLIPLFGFWKDLREGQEKNLEKLTEQWAKHEDLDNKRHLENVQRLTKLETMIDVTWKKGIRE